MSNIPEEKPLRPDDYNRVLLTSVRNGIVMKVDDPIHEIPSTSVYELDSTHPDADAFDSTDPEKVANFLWDLLDALNIHIGDRNSKRLVIEAVEREKDQ